MRGLYRTRSSASRSSASRKPTTPASSSDGTGRASRSKTRLAAAPSAGSTRPAAGAWERQRPQLLVQLDQLGRPLDLAVGQAELGRVHHQGDEPGPLDGIVTAGSALLDLLQQVLVAGVGELEGRVGVAVAGQVEGEVGVPA